MVERIDWSGFLAGRSDPADVRVIKVPLQPSPQGGSGAFLAADDSGEKWWVKPLNNRQGGKVVVTEHVVAKVGGLVGAPVCDVAIVELPPEIRGWEFRPGAEIEPGFAHASAAIDPALEDRTLTYRDRDDNGRRHAGVFALYDWCWGGDPQWLYAESRDRMIYSHDHGWYLPEEGKDWSETTLKARVDEAHLPPWPTAGLDPAEIVRLANALKNVTGQELRDILCGVPLSWPATTLELEALGWFLERRAPEVALRLEGMRRTLP